MRKLKKILYGLGLIVAVLGIVAGGGKAALAQSSVDDQVRSSLARFLQFQPNEEVAVALARSLDQRLEMPDADEVSVSPDEADKLFGIRNDFDRGEAPFERICLKDSNSYRCLAEGFEEMVFRNSTTTGDLDVATTTLSEQNLSGYTFVIDWAEMEIIGTVTSTFAASAGTSTVQYGPIYNASSTDARYPDNIIARTIFVTSSRRVEFNPGYPNHVKATSSIADVVVPVGSLDYGLRWEVPTSSYVKVFFQAEPNGNVPVGGCMPGTEGVSCENVTSTPQTRGWTAYFRYKYHYVREL